MAQTDLQRNPFMLMINPEVVLAAMEKSERLSQLNRHLCRPLDRVVDASADAAREGALGDVREDGIDETLDEAGDDADGTTARADD